MKLNKGSMIVIAASLLTAAVSLLETACTDTASATLLGANGTVGIPQEILDTNSKELIDIARVAAEGVADNQELLGVAYMRGKFGLEPNPQKAVEWFLKAAEQGNVHAMADLGMIYSMGNVDGINTDKALAASWFRKAADAGHAMAAYVLAQMYYSGDGVDADPHLSYEYMLKAAELGHNDAMYSLGTYYLEGYYVAADTQKAHKWFELAEAP